MPAEAVTVLTCGMDARKLAVFRMAFRMHTLQRYQLHEDVPDSSPAMAIVDVDSAAGWGAWHDFRGSHPDLPALVVSAFPQPDAPVPVLGKPVRIEALFPLMRSILADPQPDRMPAPAVRMVPAPVVQPALADTATTLDSEVAVLERTADPTDLPAPVQPAAEEVEAPAPAVAPRPTPTAINWQAVQRFDPNHTLYGLLVSVLTNGQPVLFGCEGRMLGWYLPAEDKVALYLPLLQLQRLADSRLRTFSEPLIDSNSLPTPVVVLGMQALMWQMAIWSCRGRLLAGIRLDTPLRLRHWPNLTRLAPLPHAVRIAAFWSRTPANLKVTATLLGLPVGALLDFVAATHALGLLEQVRPEDRETMPLRPPVGPAPAAPLPEEAVPSPARPAMAPEKKSLLSRLLHKIRSL